MVQNLVSLHAPSTCEFNRNIHFAPWRRQYDKHSPEDCRAVVDALRGAYLSVTKDLGEEIIKWLMSEPCAGSMLFIADAHVLGIQDAAASLKQLRSEETKITKYTISDVERIVPPRPRPKPVPPAPSPRRTKQTR